MFAAGGRGDKARRLELLLVVPRWRKFCREVEGVATSRCSSSDLSPTSSTNVGVLGGSSVSLESATDRSHNWGVSGVTVASDISRA